MRRIPRGELLAQMAHEAGSGLDEGELTGELLRLGARKLVQELLEAKVTDFLGRGHYERGGGEGRAGYRNGYKARRLDTAEGRLFIDVPQVRDTEEPYDNELWESMKKRTDVLEGLVVEMYARGLSTRDIEDALADLSGGEKSLLSKSSVSRLTESLWEEYEAFSKRDLSGFDVVYLFADAVYESLRRQVGMKEGILVTWAILSDGSKVLVSMAVGNKESYEDWLEHFRDLVSRGLPVPLSVTTDGAPGLTKAVEAIWPETERIRCWFHKMGNILDKVPDSERHNLKPYIEAVRDAPDLKTGKAMARSVIEEFSREYPSAMKCLADDLGASLAHLNFPPVHRKSIRTTNLVERSFVEERRRAKVIPRFRSEKECLKLVFATLWRASERWQRVRFSEVERKMIERYREGRKREKEELKKSRAGKVAANAG